MSKDAVVMFEGTIYEEGYGWVAQKVMRDRDLKPQAKAIYAYICSMAGNPTDIDNRKAFPSVSLMKAELGIKSEDTFYKYMKMLKDKGYLKVDQEKDDKGRFKRNIYKVVAVPKPEPEEKPLQDKDEKKNSSPEKEEKEPYPKKSSSGENPYPNFSSSVKSSSENRSSENWSTNRNSINRNSINSNSDNRNNLNLNHEVDPYEVLFDSELPRNLKNRIKVKMVNGTFKGLTAEQILDIEDAYRYQIEREYIDPQADRNEMYFLNDEEFTFTVIRMLEKMQGEKIHNMKGLIKEWVEQAMVYKNDRIISNT